MALRMPGSSLAHLMNSGLFRRTLLNSVVVQRSTHSSAWLPFSNSSSDSRLCWRKSATQLPVLFSSQPAIRLITTSEKKKDAGISVHHDDVSSHLNKPVDTNYVARKDWLTRGVDINDEDHDRWGYYFMLFIGISMMSIAATWYFVYIPNATWPNRDWVTREAHLELHRREKFGLPLVDPDFIPRENIVLPSEEDLKDFVVII